MTQTEQIADRVCRRNGLPATLEKELPNLPIDSCLYCSIPDVPHSDLCHCDDCRLAVRAYVDLDGTVRMGVDIKTPEPEQVDGSIFLGLIFALAVEGAFTLAFWLGIHLWRLL